MIKRTLMTGAVLALSVTAPASAVELSVWANNSDIGFAPTSIAYNPDSGSLLIAGAALLEWEKGAGTGAELVTDVDWIGRATGATYVPSRGTYMVTASDAAAIYEIIPGVAGQLPTLFVDVTAANPNYKPQGGLPQDGTYAYYKAQWTGTEQTVRRFTLVGTNGVDTEYVPYSAFQVWASSGPSQQMIMDYNDVLHLSARNSTINANKGIYRWDASSNGLVPLIQEPAIKAHTGQSNARIYGMTFDALNNLYFYEIYSSSILRLDRRGNLTTFLTSTEIRDFMSDAEMSVHPSYMIAVGTELVFITGNVSGHVLAARLPLLPEMVTIPGSDHEIDGPTYSYEIGKYEITNAQYCMFLNDAQLVQQTDPNDPRCTNMWFEPASGDVYMMDVNVFPYGSEWYNRTLYKTSDIPDSKIKYDPSKTPGSRYYVIPGTAFPPYEIPVFEEHPVGTVSWFGAAKYCNWLTITAGLDASEICYREGTSKYDWYAITASDWLNNGLLDSERLDLVRNYRGYRVPMDGAGADIGQPQVGTYWNIDANAYNEWYKAAAFDPLAPDTVRVGPGDAELVEPDHWIFGYGDDVNIGADANLSGSGDTFFETTPVGWYNGINLLADGTPTNDTRNRYGLYDMCGNVAEWVNDTFLQFPWDSTYRAIRGGRWTNSDPKWTTNSARTVTSARYYAENNIGIRVARSFGYGDFDGDGATDGDDLAFFISAMTGPVATITPGLGYEACDYDGDGHIDVRDFAAFQGAFTM